MAGLGGIKKRRRVRLILLAFVLLGLTTVLVGYAMRDGINFFRAPSQVLSDPPAPGEVFRLGGLVEPGSIERGQGTEVRFVVTDNAQSLPVAFTGILPDLFAEGQGMIGLGQMQDGVFVATEILAKHDETYMPKEVMEALKERDLYRAPSQ
ncbi:MAG: cytochrome c maturation protein CcmE [Paracoccaceae bacterium]